MSGSRRLTARRIEAGTARASEECVAEETAVALAYNGVSHAVMMATPLDIEDFARGFSLSEGIVEHVGEISDIEITATAQGICVDIRIHERRMAALRDRRRTLSGRTGCGLCGAESLEQAIRPVARVIPSELSLVQMSAAIQTGFAAMQTQQTLNRATGAMHAAALWRTDELLLREDIGRHNALDKVIGAMQRGDWSDGILLLTSRASYEMVHKSASANLAIVAAISAPTARAIDVAREAGITLFAFARGDTMTCYASPEA